MEQPIKVLIESLKELVQDHVQRRPDDLPGAWEAFRRTMEHIKQKLIRMRLKENEDCRYAVRLVQQEVMAMITIVVMETKGGGIEEAQHGRGVFHRSWETQVYEGLAALLEYLEYSYEQEFDQDIVLGEGQWHMWCMKSHRQQGILLDWFEKNGIPKDLSELVTNPYNEIIMPEGLPLFKHRKWKYLAALLNELVKLPNSCEGDAEEELLRVLVRHNFNEDAYLIYCKRYMEAALKRPDTTNAKRMEKVYHYRHLLSTEYPTCDIALRPHNDALHKRLMIWVDETQAMYEKLMAIPPEKELPAHERTETSASIPNLAAWYSLLFDCGFYLDRNLSKICRVLAFMYSTPGSKEPSSDSIYKAFGNPSEAACQFAFEMCHKILHRIDVLRRGRKPK